MLRLITFGGAALMRDGSPVIGAASARRSLATLVVLAAAGSRGLNRDALVALLWPESETGPARHSLVQVLSLLRRSLNSPELFLGTTTLHLNPACITTDVWDFEAALQNRELDRAATLYRGPFADGLSVDDAPDLEPRLAGARGDYARKFTQAAEELASAAGKRGDHRASIRWWQTLVDADPLSTNAARGLIEALVGGGERGRALHFALLHESLLREELGSSVDPEIASWILRLRANDGAARALEATGRSARPVPLTLTNVTEPVEAEEHRLAQIARAVRGRYRVEQLLQEGRVVASYAAVRTKDAGHPVELHLIQPRIAAGASERTFTDVFTRVVGLADPRILPTFDFAISEDLLFFVTARRATPSLKDRLHRDRELPIRDAVAIARDLAEALAHAHANGVRHGDLRPKHIGLTPGGTVLGGLGVIEAVLANGESNQTSTLVALGSPTYLSPEQLTSDVQVDERSDLYAFGCIVYEMLVGEPPFGRPSRLAVLGRKLTHRAPLLRAQRDSVPEALETVVETCLARVPADRYASAVELVQALATVR